MVKVASFLIVFLLGLSLVNADVSDVCTSTGSQPSGPSYTIPDTPSNVLYVVITVDIVNTAYNNDMLTGYNLLKAAVAKLNNTSTSRLHYLAPNNPITFDLNQFDQIWVVDLSANPDNEPNKVAGYKAIANWWKAKGQPHIICDARWISDIWTYSQTYGGTNKIFGYDLNMGRPNYKLVENYFYNLLIRGGGLFLGTDHAPAFVSGINDILTQIGLNPFTNFYYDYPYLLEVDDASGVLSWPNDPTHHWRTLNGTLHKYLWDDSSTGFAPYNVQPNGLIFYPMGWHGSTGSGQPGISTTIRGSTGFLISIDTPTCNQVFDAATAVAFSATAVQQGTAPYTWTWTSDLDGVIGSSASFSKALSVGIHRITVRAVDSQKLTAEAKVQVEVGLQHGTSAMCYLARYNNQPDAFEIFALKRAANVTSYYSLGKPVAGSSNTADSLEEANNGEFFFYDDGTTTSLVHIFGAKNGQSTTSTANVKFSGNILNGLTAPVQDFDSAGQFTLSGTSGAATVSSSKSTAGWVLSGFPRDSTYCVHYNFAGLSNFNQWVVRSHSADSNTVPNTNPIIAWRNKASSVPALDLCYAKCRCDATQTLTALSDSFNTGILLDPVTGDKANYFPNTACSWLIKPQSPTGDAIWGIALYFTAMSLGAGDSVSVYNGSDATGTLLGTYTGTTLPGTIKVDGPGPVFVQFNSDSDASVGLGFTATYSVIPQLLAVTPNNIPSKAKTVVTVSGANFYNSALLACQFDNTVVAAKYVDSKTITCVAPMHQLGFYNFEVSNDGVTFTWTWADSPHGVVGLNWRGYKCYDGR